MADWKKIMSRTSRLLELQDIELELQGRMQSYKKVQTKLAASSPVEKAHKIYEQRVEKEKKARSDQNNMTLELQSLAEKIQHTEQRLYSGTIKNPKELHNLQKELESLKKRKDELEEKAIFIIEKIDKLAQSVIRAKQQYENVQAASAERQEALLKREHALKRYISKTRRKRQKILDQVSAKDLEQYRYVQRKKGNLLAITKLRQGACGACHVEVSAARRDKIEQLTDQNKLSTCGNCGRILVS